MTSVDNKVGMCLTRLWDWRTDMRSVRVTPREKGTVRGTARRPHFSLAIISVTVQLRIEVFWVRSVYFKRKEHSAEVWYIPPGTLCIHIAIWCTMHTTLSYSMIPPINTRTNPMNSSMATSRISQIEKKKCALWDQLLTALHVNITVCRNVMLLSLVKRCQRFGRMRCLQL